MNKWQTAATALLLVSTVGCGQNNNSSGKAHKSNHSQYMEVKQPLNQPKKGSRRNLTSQDIAKHLVKIAEGVPHVKHATAIVTIGYAVIGINVDKDMSRSKVTSIKKSVAKAVKHNPYGANAVVIADPDAVHRLKGMRKSIKSGRPVSGILEELSQIISNVTPQTPNGQNQPAPHQKKMEQTSENNQ